MKTKVRRAREFDVRSLPRSLRTLQFTKAEARRIDLAAAAIGRPGEGPSFGRNVLLNATDEILRSNARSRKGKM
jgi:hypothetical protein